MDPVFGPPEQLADRREDLTPMLAQYLELCTRYDEAIVLFQVGDFYETFCEQAERCARELELTLTSRSDSTGEYPMAGIPVDSAASYIEGLLEAGYRVAVADQVEEPSEADGVVDRQVTRVVTPGTLTEDELLAGDENNFVAAISRGDGSERTTDGATLGLALLDVSTGDFLATSSTRERAIADEVSRFDPAEVIRGPDAPRSVVPDGPMVTTYEESAFDRDAAGDLLAAYVGDPETILAGDAEIRACGALLAYAEYARGGIPDAEGSGDGDGADGGSDDGPRLPYLTELVRYDPREHLLLDAVALRSLELFEPRAVDGRADATLAGVLDRTESALGRRTLHDWLRRPLLEPSAIEARLDAVEELTTGVRTREAICEAMKAVYDLERLIGRISRGRANARDLRSLEETLAVVPDVREAVADAESDRLREIWDALDPLADVRDLIDRAIVEEPPIELTEGGIVADGYDADLDALRATAREGERWIDDLEARERERTGIDSLKVGYNSVHGYYVEVTKPNLEAVPEEYERRQTLKRAERFVTPELREREDEIVGAERRAQEREYDLFCDVRETVADEVERVQALARALGDLDALVSLATVAAEFDYCRPAVVDPADREGSDAGPVVLEIERGRHPVVERTQERFVPNDATFDADRRLAVITGPNMSGKSTYMRQIACLVVLAQIGSFVPARAMRLTPVERIFTRVGASDDIAGGRSTFMVEMDELATILREADERSLVLLDEVGRGTATADGLAIARAIAEHLHDAVGATTLFATHHHPLTDLAETLERAVTLHFEASEVDGEVVFHHEIAPGAADGSYGIEVATAAGVPSSVVERAREIADATADDRPAASADQTAADPSAPAPRSDGAPDATAPAASTDGGADAPAIERELRALEIGHLTPVEAIAELDRLKRLLEE